MSEFPHSTDCTCGCNDHKSCPSHCCVYHGCKYGYDDCPVVLGKVDQDHICEDCDYIGLKTVEEAKNWAEIENNPGIKMAAIQNGLMKIEEYKDQPDFKDVRSVQLQYIYLQYLIRKCECKTDDQDPY
jgi:hypothetical protein